MLPYPKVHLSPGSITFRPGADPTGTNSPTSLQKPPRNVPSPRRRRTCENLSTFGTGGTPTGHEDHRGGGRTQHVLRSTVTDPDPLKKRTPSEPTREGLHTGGVVTDLRRNKRRSYVPVTTETVSSKTLESPDGKTSDPSPKLVPRTKTN